MATDVITAIPLYNAENLVGKTLESIARQTRKPDRVVVLDDCSRDASAQVVQSFKGLPIEYIRNPTALGTFGNFNRCLDFAVETEYLQILHQDDLIAPEFYEIMTRQLEDCPGLGMAWCLDERIDEHGQKLSVSGKPDGSAQVLDMDTFLARKAEIGNQAFSSPLLNTNCHPLPHPFPPAIPFLA